MTRRVVLALLLALAVLVPAASRRDRDGDDADPPEPVHPDARAGAAEREARDRDLPRATTRCRLARPLPEAGPRHGRDLRQGPARLDASASGRARRARSRPVASTTRPGPSPRPGPGRRSPGRWPAAASGAFGGREINSLPIWLGLCAIFLIGLADFRRPLTLRNLDLLVLLSFSVSLWFFNRGRHLHGRAARVSAAGVPARAHGLVGLARWARARAPALAGLAARVGDGLPRRIPHRPQRAQLERDRRRLLGRDRRESDRARTVAVRAHAAGGEPEGVRQRGCGGRDPGSDPDERPLRVCERARRHVRAGRLRVVHPRVPRSSVGAGAGTSCPRRTRRRSPSTCSRSSAWRCSDAASAGCASPPRSRSRGPRTRSRSTCRARTRTTRSCPCS